MQVVTSENFQQFVETGKVPEFKPPEGAKPAEPTKKYETAKAAAEKVDKPEEKSDKSDAAGATPEDEAAKAAAAKAEEDDDADLSEKVRKKIGAKHRAMKEAEEFAEQQYNERKAAERRAERLEQELAEAKSKSRPDQEQTAKVAPKPDDFKTVAEYADALTDFLLEKKLSERQAADEGRRQKEAADRVKSEFSQRIAKAMKDIPDYDEVVSAADVDVPPHISQHIVESDMGPLLGYHLAKHPEELDRLRKLSPIRAVAELGKLEMKLEKKSEPAPDKAAKTEAQQVSRAPAPITPLDGKSTTVEKDPSKMTFQELREYDRKQRAAKRNR